MSLLPGRSDISGKIYFKYICRPFPWGRSRNEYSIESKEGWRPVKQSLRNLKIATYILVLAISIQLGLPAQLSAQVVGATLSGTVTDTSGGVVPNADVTAKNVSNGITRTATTNGSGLFTVPNLQPGPYEITVAAGGFNTDVRSGVTLNVGQELVLNFTVKPGMAVQRVEVNAEAPTVNLANATIGGINDSTTVAELPLNGRSWTDLATLQPGVHLSQDQPPINAGDRVKRGLGLELTISGARPQQNNYMLDGVNINDYANAGPGSVLGGNLGTDAVAEFSILTTNYAAEYGRTSGGVISAITKTGTNQFHGSAYEFIRNSALDARNFFDPPVIPPFRRNQYGGSAGGPIQKDKTFIFGDYEGVSQGLGSTSLQNVPTLAARNGTLFYDPTAVDSNNALIGPPDGCTQIGITNQCKLTVDPGIAKLLSSNLIPLPNQPVPAGSNSGQFGFQAFQITRENFFTVRADHNFSDKDRIFTTYLFDKASQSEPDEYQTKLLHNPMLRQMVAIEENHVITANLLNSVRVGFNRDNVESPSGATAINPAAADQSLGFVPGSTVGNISIGSDNLAGYSGGLDVAAPFKFHWNSIQAYDNLFYTKGIHSMKFGVNVERLRGNTFGADFPGGQLIFNGNGRQDTGLSDFLTNRSADINADVPGTVTGRGVRQTIFGAYFQDDTHVRPNLSVNWGLRYEMASIITEASGKLSNLRVLSSLKPGDPGYPVHTGSPYIMNPTKRNFEPRVGFAWDPFKNGKTSVAGGFGLFDVLPLPVEMGSGVDGSFPFDIAYSATGLLTPYVPNANCSTSPNSGAFCQAQNSQSSRFYVMQFDPKRNYVMQWNLNIQRQLGAGTSLMVGYVGARGRHMRFQADDVNMVYPTLTPQGYVWPTPNDQPVDPTTTLCPNGSTPNPTPPPTGCPWPVFNQFMGRTQMAIFDGNYYYNGLQVQFKKAMSHGFQIESSYTWSKNIDDGGGSVASDPFRNSISTLLWFCERCRRALSDQDQRHNLTLNYVWDIPTRASFGALPRAILGNWEAGGILSIQSGTPFTVLVSGDPLGENNTDPFQYPDLTNKPGCDNPVNPQNANGYIKLQCFALPTGNRLGTSGRNGLIGPGLIDMDFSLFKNIPITKISESFKAQFRTEVFNIFNRPNFTSPNDNRAIMDPTGQVSGNAGVFTLTNTTSRQIQFALKLTW
jgi:Carboxypeptidase regulatory-like domain/TonB-dependent Receptor Plug Domain